MTTSTHNDNTMMEGLYQQDENLRVTKKTTKKRDIRVRAYGCQLHWPRVFTLLSYKYRQWKWLHQSEFAWCFRSTSAENEEGISIDQQEQYINNTRGWTPFESKNQVKLWQAYYNQPYQHQQPYIECHIHDKLIDDGKQLVRIILNEHVAFTMDPDWSQPLVYEIAVCRVMRRSARTLWREWVLGEKQTGPMYQ
ncbi:hypothetical protein INT45_007912 [Circinella minor]|uniref:Uncharacterized protein n=1 Tax=Circinella minor TaxID=1195481 RepID=A0A8H7SAF6_9FUNG|nr:hypothetical protein INT45_007912 [Circinella minor]